MDCAENPMLASFEISAEKFRDLMQTRGIEARDKIVRDFGDIPTVCAKLHTDANRGLTGHPADLANRKRVYGSNEIAPAPPKSFWRLIVDAFNDTTLIILLIAAGVSFIAQFLVPSEEGIDWLEIAGILTTVLVIVLVSSYNDYQKQNQFRALAQRILVTELVVGDICQLKYGDLIPADGILLASNDLKADESSLTGESDMVKKSICTDPMMLSGTYVMEGSGRMVLVAVGVNSQAGIIFKLLGATEGQEQEKKPRESKKDRAKRRKQKKLLAKQVKDGQGKNGFKVETQVCIEETKDGIQLTSVRPVESAASGGDAGPSCTSPQMQQPLLGTDTESNHTREYNPMDDLDEGSKSDEESVLQKKLSRLASQIGWFGMYLN